MNDPILLSINANRFGTSKNYLLFLGYPRNTCRQTKSCRPKMYMREVQRITVITIIDQ
jgi:hypothetical protein